MRLTDKNKIKELATLEKNKVLMTDADYKELKLGKLENIEEELGIDLATFIKIFEKGIFVKNESTNNKIEYWSPFDIKVIKSTYQTDICYIRSKKNKYVGCFNYGKTWALTKEELLWKQ